MEINDILQNGEEDEIIAFLSSYVPMLYSDMNFKVNSRIKDIDRLINEGPNQYINSVCVKACEDLWKKNIYVLDSVEFDNDIYLIFDKLDKKNKTIFKSKNKQNKQNYYEDLGEECYFGIRVNDCLSKNDEQIENEFCKLVSDFEIQDVQRGFLNEKAFLMNICNCEKVKGIKEYEDNNPEIVFDRKKVEKTFDEYLKETGYEKFYIPKENRIYLNEHYYNSHQNYLKNKKKRSIKLRKD